MQLSPEALTNFDAGSITVHLHALKCGDSSAQELLFGRLLPEVVLLARKRIRGSASRYHDEHDLALEVLGVLLMRASSFDRLHNRSDLARLLTKLVEYKAVDAYRKMRRLQRIEVSEAGRPSGAQSRRRFRTLELSSCELELIAAELFDALLHVISRLKDDALQCQHILKLLVEGYSVAEISQIVGRGERSIYRLLERIEREFLKSGKVYQF
jgi:DNA-directed RNA polymerase specialized sigma24 family protein